jgi:hypothetical protein
MVDDSASACWCTPSNTSKVATIGLALSGILVNGIIAMAPQRIYDIAWGYPDVVRILEVTGIKLAGRKRISEIVIKVLLWLNPCII